MIMGSYAASREMLTSTRVGVRRGMRHARGTRPLRGFGDEESSAGGEVSGGGEGTVSGGGGGWIDAFTKFLDLGGKVIDRVVPWPPKGAGPTRVAPAEGPSFSALPWVVGGAAVLGVGAVILTLKK